MNIIFLDIDGVLNCQLFYESKQFKDYRDAKKTLRKDVKSERLSKQEYYKSQICTYRMGLLNDLCREVNGQVVISSTWRHGKTVSDLQEIMNVSGATFDIIGKTEHFGFERGPEIAKWLRDNCMQLFGVHYFDFYNYAIIDDDSDMLLTQEAHFFQTDNYSGLTPNTCYRIKRFLTRKTFK